jgi:hypothetical protein
VSSFVRRQATSGKNRRSSIRPYSRLQDPHAGANTRSVRHPAGYHDRGNTCSRSAFRTCCAQYAHLVQFLRLIADPTMTDRPVAGPRELGGRSPRIWPTCGSR